MECQAIKERKDVTHAIALALAELSPDRTSDLLAPIIARGEYGTEKGLAVVASVLHGIVNEYLDGGDQMVESCTCGEHRPDPGDHPDSDRPPGTSGSWGEA